jgi:uncharacterized Fe-S cluster protein YjdI
VLLDTDSREGAGKDAPKRPHKPVPICEYFHRGKCTFGDNCVKSHDPLPLYKKDLKDIVLRSTAEVAAKKKAAGQVVPTAAPAASNKSVKVKTEKVIIKYNRNVMPEARPPVNYNNLSNSSSSTAMTVLSRGTTTSRTTASFIVSGVSLS